ncbi:MAG: type IV secretory system conjugative DNA transfer family protein, partial [Fimbriimonadaceae bacterium]
GAIGEENAALLGSLFVSKIHQLALGRQSLAENERKPFFVYLDEFQHFVTPSMATLLTGARKYKLGLVLAHQELRQLWNQDRDVAGAVLANAATRICFRVGDDDAKKLEDGFTSFSARDIQNLGVGQAICRVDRADWDFSLTTVPMPQPRQDESAHREQIVQASRERYATRLAVVEATGATPIERIVNVAPRQTRRPERADSIESAVPTGDRTPAEQQPILPGRGGAQHKYVQELIRRWGEANGWRVDIEKAIHDGLGSVDVALERGDHRVACEVSITSTPSYEVGNARKCLAAGFTQVAVVTLDRKTEAKLRTVLVKELGTVEGNQVEVLGVEDLFGYLGRLSQPATLETTTKGYKVTVRGRSQSVKAGTAAREVVARTLVAALRRLRE